jgi:hypothetical protein
MKKVYHCSGIIEPLDTEKGYSYFDGVFETETNLGDVENYNILKKSFYTDAKKEVGNFTNDTKLFFLSMTIIGEK